MRPEQLIDPITSKELGIQENDLWLCAQAVGHGMVLVTNDAMCRIREVSQDMRPALLMQNWTIPNTARIE
jgi:predicted nucleic acid-binding protein